MEELNWGIITVGGKTTSPKMMGILTGTKVDVLKAQVITCLV
jgi:hypothetical protein